MIMHMLTAYAMKGYLSSASTAAVSCFAKNETPLYLHLYIIDQINEDEHWSFWRMGIVTTVIFPEALGKSGQI